MVAEVMLVNGALSDCVGFSIGEGTMSKPRKLVLVTPNVESIVKDGLLGNRLIGLGSIAVPKLDLSDLSKDNEAPA